MQRSVKQLEDCSVGASDGELGTVNDVYSDDERWTIRYMVVKAGGWLSGRKVLISPSAVREVAWADHVMHVSLTKQQVRDSPSIDTDKPVSRQHEIDYYNYYGYPNYWEGGSLGPWRVSHSLGRTLSGSGSRPAAETQWFRCARATRAPGPGARIFRLASAQRQ